MFSEFPFLLICWRKRNFIRNRSHHCVCFWKSWRTHLELAPTLSCLLPFTSWFVLYYPVPMYLLKCFISFMPLCMGFFINRKHLYYCLFLSAVPRTQYVLLFLAIKEVVELLPVSFLSITGKSDPNPQTVEYWHLSLEDGDPAHHQEKKKGRTDKDT